MSALYDLGRELQVAQTIAQDTDADPPLVTAAQDREQHILDDIQRLSDQALEDPDVIAGYQAAGGVGNP